MKRFISLLSSFLLLLALVPEAWAAPPHSGPPNGWVATPPVHVRQGPSKVGPSKAPPLPAVTVSGPYVPTQIRSAYGIDQLSANGTGQTIAIVDAYGSRTVQSDLAYFSSYFGLPAANLTIAYPQGKPAGFNSGWAIETSLDVEWAHALAPNAEILLVVAKSASFTNLLNAVDYATGHAAKVVSMSWGGSEFSGESSYDYHFNHTGVVYTASSGDSGYGPIWPAAAPNVVAVGGTTLINNGGVWSETAWSGSGGGPSAYEAEAAYQSGYGIANTAGKRAVPDVSFDADPNSGVYVYSGGGWYQVGGTSVGAPSWAALVALANQGRSTSLSDGHSALYTLANPSTTYSSDYRDVTSGTNGSCGAFCTSGSGYDLVTGLGSPLTNNLVPGLTSAP